MMHAEFIEKLSSYKPIADFCASGASFQEASTKFGMTPQRIGIARSFYNRRKDEIQCEWMGELSHPAVLGLNGVVNLSSKESARADLVKSYRFDPDGKMKHWPKSVSRAAVSKVMKYSGLRWFKHKGVLYVHWNEKP